MVATDLIRCALHALLAALIFTGAVEIWHIVVIEAVFGAAEAFFRPAFTGLCRRRCPRPMLQEANAATSVDTVAEFAGPALATALVLGLGAGWAFALDAATFLVSAVFLSVCGRAAAARRRRRLGARRAARGLDRVPRARVGVGDRRDLLPLLIWPSAVDRARPDRGGGRLRQPGVFGVLAAAMGPGTIARRADRLALAARARCWTRCC